MHLYFRNANDAFEGLCRGFATGRFIRGDRRDTQTIGGEQYLHTIVEQPPMSRQPTRYGQCIVINEPVTITYTNPLERVLWNPYRDCNPFLHLIEALWVLSGSNDCKPLANFAKRMVEFADEDLSKDDIPYKGQLNRVTVAGNPKPGTLWWGAYGYRYRNWFNQDQLATCIHLLRSDPTTRRVVLQAWEPADLERVRDIPSCKDVPCNTEIMFLPRPGPREGLLPSQLIPPKKRADGNHDDLKAETHKTLDMTVINRSNDMLWGALGSNYVTFSVLHEYVALASGYAVGRYNQISNNLHVYSGNNDQGVELWSQKWKPDELNKNHCEEYDTGYNHFPLFVAPLGDPLHLQEKLRSFEQDCFLLFSDPMLLTVSNPSYLYEKLGQPSPFFDDVVIPMIVAHNLCKQRDYRMAQLTINRCYAPDWRLAGLSWIKRRQFNYENRKAMAQDDGIKYPAAPA